MSDRKIAKNRFHKGLTAYLRRYLRRFGVSLDEETAQFMLGGVRVFEGIPDEAVIEAVNLTLGNRPNLMKEWEATHPGRNPFPPSFPERVIRLVNQALRECYDEDSSPAATLDLIKNMCEMELNTEPVSITDTEEDL